MKDPERARRFFQKGMEDMRALRPMVSDESFSDSIFGFHAQQAAEKFLKAWLAGIGEEAPKTHDIDFLVGMLEKAGVTLPEPFQALGNLADFAVIFRYEILELSRPVNREDIVETIQELSNHVNQFIKGH